ncbi:MAG: sporulation protein YqfD [Clostridia bacterium]
MKPLVRIKVIGYNLDQLINKLQSNNIVVYNIERVENNVMFFSINFKQYKVVKPMLKNYEYHIKYLGIANFKTWLKKNIAILLVIPFAFTLMAFSTKFTWKIEIYGGEGELESSVIEILKDNNIAKGKFLPQDNKIVEDILLKQLPNVAQVSCMTRGTTIIINISKKLVYTPETYAPIVATYSGIITNFSLISGTMAVNSGDFVNKGDILVYPFTLDKDGNQVMVKPIAEVRAKAYVVGSSKLSATQTELARTGKTYTTSSMTLLNKNLFSKKSSKPFALYESYVYNENISSVLPIKRTKVTYYELDYVLVNYDLVAEQGRVERESIDLAYLNLPTNSEILDEKTTSLIINDTLYSTTTLTISTIIS